MKQLDLEQNRNAEVLKILSNRPPTIRTLTLTKSLALLMEKFPCGNFYLGLSTDTSNIPYKTTKTEHVNDEPVCRRLCGILITSIDNFDLTCQISKS